VKLYVIAVVAAAVALGIPLLVGNALRPTLITLVVTGRVITSEGSPIGGAQVQAALGLDQEGPVVKTNREGRFTASACDHFWYKGEPYVHVSAAGYVDAWVRFQQWRAGERTFYRRVVVQRIPHPESP